eukprot:363245-Chlamydomonas_euryale.AAC.2
MPQNIFQHMRTDSGVSLKVVGGAWGGGPHRHTPSVEPAMHLSLHDLLERKHEGGSAQRDVAVGVNLPDVAECVGHLPVQLPAACGQG